MSRIGLSGHSRGGEGVVAAEFIKRAESLGFQIRAVNAIAPTDQDPLIHYVPQVPYFLLIAASDGDVSNLQGLRTYDRTSLAAAAVQSEKSMLWSMAPITTSSTRPGPPVLAWRARWMMA